MCLEGIWFRSRLYFSKSLNPLVGEVVQVAFDDSASDYLVVIRGENRIRVKLSTYRITGTSLSHDPGSDLVVVQTNPKRQDQ